MSDSLYVRRCDAELECVELLAEFLRRPGPGRLIVLAGDAAIARRLGPLVMKYLPREAYYAPGRDGKNICLEDRLVHVPDYFVKDINKEYFSHVVVYFARLGPYRDFQPAGGVG